MMNDTSSTKILLIDDDEKLRKLVREYMEEYGFDIEEREDGLDACAAIAEHAPELVVLDVMMPGRDGLDVLKDIRVESKVPVIMLTAKGDDTDRIVGLELGADDYVAKPFTARELLARIRAVLRRAQPEEAPAPQAKTPSVILQVGDLTLNKSKQTLSVGGSELELPGTEYKLLQAMMEHPDTVLTRDELMSLVHGREFMAYDRSIDVHISKLRGKLAEFPGHEKRIKTVWGTGYMLLGAE